MSKSIALVFDFDETLAHDSTTAYLRHIGVDVTAFWNSVDALLDEGWDPIPAYLYRMIEESENGKRITKEGLVTFGPKVTLFPGASRVFSKLLKHVSAYDDIKLEFYLISSGVGDILRSTKIASHFTEIWSSEFAYNKFGKILFPSRIVSFTDKTRYLFSISKGLIGGEFRNKPFEVNERVEKGKFRIPFDQMIFVGDGMTDIPCFALIKKMGGIPIAVYDPTNPLKWGKAWNFVEQDRVKALLPADYSTHSALLASLRMAIDCIAKKITLADGYQP